MARKAEVTRKTAETDITLTIELDGEGKYRVQSPAPFLNHMLELFARHGLFDLTVIASGDSEIDLHHTVEDIGICLGDAVDKALGDKTGIKRYGTSTVPMDEALATAVVDLWGRPFLVYEVEFGSDKVGEFDWSSSRSSSSRSRYMPGPTCISSCTTARTPTTWPRPASSHSRGRFPRRLKSTSGSRGCCRRRGSYKQPQKCKHFLGPRVGKERRKEGTNEEIRFPPVGAAYMPPFIINTSLRGAKKTGTLSLLETSNFFPLS